MSNSKKAPVFSSNVGTSSILLIFVVLCLVSFAALSIVTANADRILTDKIAARTLAYYDACNQAEEALAKLDNKLYNIYSKSPDESSFFTSAGRETCLSYPLSDSQSLNISIGHLYPSSDKDSLFEIRSWKVVTDTSNMEYSDRLPVFTP